MYVSSARPDAFNPRHPSSNLVLYPRAGFPALGFEERVWMGGAWKRSNTAWTIILTALVCCRCQCQSLAAPAKWQRLSVLIDIEDQYCTHTRTS